MKTLASAVALGAILISGAALAYPNGTPDGAHGAHGQNPYFAQDGGLKPAEARRDAELDPRAYHGPYDPWRARAID